MNNINIFDTEMFPYLEGEEIKGTHLTLTIANICQEELESGGRSKAKWVLYFRETPKGFVLNKTNAKRIAQMYGKMTGEWAAKQITLTTELVQAFGETHNALRVVPGILGETTQTMGLVDVHVLLNRVDRIKDSGIYPTPEAVMICRKNDELPPPEDLDGWRQLYEDARDHALEIIENGTENSEPPIPQAAPVATETESPPWRPTLEEFVGAVTVGILALREKSEQEIFDHLIKAGYTIDPFDPGLAQDMMAKLEEDFDDFDEIPF